MFGGVLSRTSLLIGGVEVWHPIKHQAQTKTMETGTTARHLRTVEGPSSSEEAQLEQHREMAKREPMISRQVRSWTIGCLLLPSSNSLTTIIGAAWIKPRARGVIETLGGQWLSHLRTHGTPEILSRWMNPHIWSTLTKFIRICLMRLSSSLF